MLSEKENRKLFGKRRRRAEVVYLLRHGNRNDLEPFQGSGTCNCNWQKRMANGDDRIRT